MKKLIILFLSALLAVSLASSMSSAEGLPDLSGLSFDQLVALREQINLAIWNSQEWQEVTVPAGVWEIGKDIPSGHWSITPAPETFTSVIYCDKLNEYGNDPAPGWRGWNGTLTSKTTGITITEQRQVDLDMVEGMYFINRHDCIFTPYTGKPDLGFK